MVYQVRVINVSLIKNMGGLFSTESKNFIDESTSVVNTIISNAITTTNQSAVQLITINQINKFFMLC